MFAALAIAAAAAPMTAEQAIETQRRQLQEAVGTAPCDREAAPGEIVVCGRRGPDPNRIPFPDQREPGERVRLLASEPPSAAAALSATAGSPCGSVGAYQHCSGGLDGVQFVTAMGKLVSHILGKDD